MWKCPNCKKEFKEPIKKHIKFWRRGYHFFMFCPYCRVEIFSDGTLFLAKEGDKIYEVTKTTEFNVRY
jgi:hypothetical protein